MNHAEAIRLIEAYDDGALEASRADAFEAHLAACRKCRDELEAWQNSRDVMGEVLDPGRAPEALRARIRAATVERHRLVAPPLPAWTRQAAALILVAALSSVATVALFRPQGGDRVQTLMDAHMRAQDPGRMIEVVSSDQHTVKPWLDARLDFAPPVEDLTAQGFPLLGGRLDYVDGRRAAVLVYGRRKHVIDVFVRPSGDGPAPPQAGDRRGFHLIGWRQGGFDWWAVSDVDVRDLKALHRLLEDRPRT